MPAQTSPSFADATQNVARQIEENWHDAQYDDDAFPGIARRVLTKARLHDRFGARDVIREGLENQLIVPQLDIGGRFGQPPVTFFRNARFYIAVLFWVDSTTSVHEHGFSGAFSVLDGASLHVRYRFTPHVRVNSRLSVGEMAQQGASILERGTVEEIVAGSQGAHALFHLERPSATLIVRTHSDDRAQPQLTYHWPHYALDPFFEDHELRRKCQLLRLAYDTDRKTFPGLAATLLGSLDLESALRTLLSMRQLNLSVAMAQELAAVVSRRHGELAAGLEQFVAHGHREQRLVALRRAVVDRERRLLLAFLLNRLTATEVTALVARQHPGADPVDLVTQWLASLLEDIGGMEETPIVRRAIRFFVAGDDKAMVVEKLAKEFDITDGTDLEAAASLVSTLSDSPLLSSLLSGPAITAWPRTAAPVTAREPPPASPPRVASCSPILYVKQFESADACRALRDAYDTGLRDHRFTPRAHHARTDIALATVTNNQTAERLYRAVAARLRAQFQLPPLCIDYCAYSRLMPGGLHPLHADAVTLAGAPNHTPNRIASAMLFLSDGETDFRGGTLRFPRLEIEITPRPGLLVGFLTDLRYQHEVRPVTAGLRDAIAIWFCAAA